MSFVYDFDHRYAEEPRTLKALLGGKGANLAEMTSVLGLPVPPGFTITTEACRAYLAGGMPAGLLDEVRAHLGRLEAAMGRGLGAPDDPLLLSVRSGGPFSMPGMMDTVLNLGLTDASVEGLARATGDERFAYDSYRRLIGTYARVVLGLPAEPFDGALEDAKRAAGARYDAALPADKMRALVATYQALVADLAGQPFPQDGRVQLERAIEAVFRSWNAPRATAYRKRERIPHDLGTAVNVQAMVFGNRDDRSGTGVGFTRDPATGAAGAYGDFLLNAQGEDVVAGIRNPEPLAALGERFPEIHRELLGIFHRLEVHYRDMLDTEFTIEQGKLWMLQTRVGKRTGLAAVRMAVAMTEDPHIRLTQEETVLRVKPVHLDQLLHPRFVSHDRPVIATGLGASPGAAVGRAVFSAEAAEAAAARGEKVILVRTETSPEDVAGLAVSEGVLTSRGGLVSHAAVVARGWGKPAVCGARDVEIQGESFTAGSHTVREGDALSIDGTSGEVVLGELRVEVGTPPPELETVLGWADDIRRGKLGVRANADNGEDAARARAHGAEGIGLCRTEHMFLGDRLPVCQRVILADTPEKEQAALDELLEVQRRDFEALLEAMDGLPVVVRLLDPPLHEFLPHLDELIAKEARGELTAQDRALYAAARSWREDNPMLGTRGVRLGIVKNGLYRMQVRALMQAATRRARAGGNPIVEIMIPLVVVREELALVRAWAEEEIRAELAASGREVTVLIGTMIETPRAALCADEIAEVADFFSFGTNDLTQMTFGFSRDDVEGRIMARYLDRGILPRNPFESIDTRGVGALVELAVARGRETKPGLEMGVCGEHGGDPDSIAFFYRAGLDYVSCSPYRVPVARLAAAQAILAAGEGRSANG
jgi:pyruvate, orthophosphate dikinase